MKKTYISPESLVVKLSCKSLVATSYTKYDEGATGCEVLVKEDYPPISDKSVWDDEW